jgi:hypothetical protein
MVRMPPIKGAILEPWFSTSISPSSTFQIKPRFDLLRMRSSPTCLSKTPKPPCALRSSVLGTYTPCSKTRSSTSPSCSPRRPVPLATVGRAITVWATLTKMPGPVPRYQGLKGNLDRPRYDSFRGLRCGEPGVDSESSASGLRCDARKRVPRLARRAVQPPSSPLGAQIAIGIEVLEAPRMKVIEEPAWMQDPPFQALIQISTSTGDTADAGDQAGVNYATLLSGCTTAEEAAELVNEAVVQKLCKALTSSVRDIDAGKPLHAYDVGSLVAVELCTWFLKEIGAEATMCFDIMDGASIRALGALAAK